MSIQSRSRAVTLACTALALSAIAVPAASQTLHDYVEAASGRDPELAALLGRREAIGARQRAAGAFLPGAPTLSGSFLTDQAIRDRSQREAQLGVSTPIWLPGEGTAARRLADTEYARSSPQATVLRLKLALRVRDALAEFALAQAEATVSERRLADARALEGDVGRRARAREASDADALLAKAERIAADAELRDRRSVLGQARLEFEGLVGLPPAAAALSERVAPGTDASHPRLEEARGAVKVARANQALIGLQSRDSPEVGIIARRNRDIGGRVYDNSVGVEVRIPFSTEARNGPRRAAAQADLTEASAGYAAAEREVGTEQRKARVAYDAAVAQRDLLRERAAALARQSALVGRGYRGGETSLFDTVRSRAAAFDAEAAKVRADIGVARAIGRLNQAFGIVP